MKRKDRKAIKAPGLGVTDDLKGAKRKGKNCGINRVPVANLGLAQRYGSQINYSPAHKIAKEIQEALNPDHRSSIGIVLAAHEGQGVDAAGIKVRGHFVKGWSNGYALINCYGRFFKVKAHHVLAHAAGTITIARTAVNRHQELRKTIRQARAVKAGLMRGRS